MYFGVTKGCFSFLDKQDIYILKDTSSRLNLNFMNSVEGIPYLKGYPNHVLETV